MNSYYGLNIQRDEKEDQHSRQLVDKWIFITLMAVLILVPLLIGSHVSNVISPLISDNSLLSSGLRGDMYTYYKYVTLITLTIVAFLLFLYKMFILGYKLPMRIILYFFVVFSIAVLISTMFSPNKTIALFGQYNRADGAYSYLCYIILMFIAMNIEYPKKVLEYVLYAFYPVVFLNFVLIMMNFTGHDVLSYRFYQKIMTMFDPKGVTFGAGSYELGTFSHGNYISGMFSIMTIMFLSWAVIDKNIIRRFINVFVALLSMATLLMGTSNSGFFTFLCMTPFIIWLAIRSSNKKLAIISLVVFLILSASTLNILALKKPIVWDESVGMFIKHNPYMGNPAKQTSLKSSSGLQPSIIVEHKVYAADNKFILPVLPKSAWTAGTGRIYIWKEALKLVAERPFFGYGLDTILYHFPDFNIEARANLSEATIVDKTHSLYVGVIYGTGIVGMIGFLGILIIIGWTALKEILRFKPTSGFIVPLCMAWITYLIQALFNDSVLGVTSSFFTIGGVLLAVLYKKKEIGIKEIQFNKNII
ncbi:MAG: O-antigen ligase family protein [Bacillota bacterium]|nr:O-antigen ligase family protein [Bacillota bacterium]